MEKLHLTGRFQNYGSSIQKRIHIFFLLLVFSIHAVKCIEIPITKYL